MQTALRQCVETLQVQTYSDGPAPLGLRDIQMSWEATWRKHYHCNVPLQFRPPINIKNAANRTTLPDGLRYIEKVRNPDLYFFERTKCIELGGVEITDHSPDGSNIEKRYPYLWASRRRRLSAFVASRYLKRRPSGQINRLPFRHAFRNMQFLKEWAPGAADGHGQLCQFLPMSELHLEDIALVPPSIRELLGHWDQLGEFFAHSLAAKVFTGSLLSIAKNWLSLFKTRLEQLAEACIASATRETEASTLLKLPTKWIQLYNTRPDSGHWERGEGQFDSIDGRIMFTLDEISLLAPGDRPRAFEFWLPQMVSSHAWIAEQRQRGFASKRLRNLLVELREMCTTKFADELCVEDWQLLTSNKGLLLERLDWEPSVYRVVDLVPTPHRERVARIGLLNSSKARVSQITSMLSNEDLYFSAHRPYIAGWRAALIEALEPLPSTATVLVPRIPSALIGSLPSSVRCHVKAAEHCTKDYLLMLRQLHRDKA